MQLCKALINCDRVVTLFLFFFPDVNRVDFVSENLRRGRRQGLKDKKNVSRDLGQRG